MLLRRSSTLQGETLADNMQRVNRRTLLRGAVGVAGLLVSRPPRPAAPRRRRPAQPVLLQAAPAPRRPRPHPPRRTPPSRPGRSRRRQPRPPRQPSCCPGSWSSRWIPTPTPTARSTRPGSTYRAAGRLGFAAGLVGALAESCNTPGPETWIFSLKHGVTFHDGSEFTAGGRGVLLPGRIQNDPESEQQSARPTSTPSRRSTRTPSACTPKARMRPCRHGWPALHHQQGRPRSAGPRRGRCPAIGTDLTVQGVGARPALRGRAQTTPTAAPHPDRRRGRLPRHPGAGGRRLRRC